MVSVKTIRQTIEWLQAELLSALGDYGKDVPESELRGELRAEVLFMLSHVTGKPPGELLACLDKELAELVSDADAAVSVLKSMITRRGKREPLQYILGSTEFMGLEFDVDPSALIPRPDTERLVDEAIKVINRYKGIDPFRVLDLCTGSGCIAVSLKSAFPGIDMKATELCEEAVELAGKNAVKNRTAIDFFQGDLFEATNEKGEKIEGEFDLITANPPYIETKELEVLAPEISLYEPRMALDAGMDGLDFIERILFSAPIYLKPGASLVMEIGYGQASRIMDLAYETDKYDWMEMKEDYSGIERVFVAERAR